MLSRLRDRLWRGHWIAWLLLIILVILVSIALPIFLDYRRAAMDLVMEVDRQVTQLSAVRIRDELAEFPNALVTLARTQEMASKDQATQRAALEQALPIREGLFDGGIVLLDNFGKVTAAEPPWPEIIGQDWSDRNFFRQLLSSSASTVIFSNAMDDGREGSQVVVVSVPVLGGRWTLYRRAGWDVATGPVDGQPILCQHCSPAGRRRWHGLPGRRQQQDPF